MDHQLCELCGQLPPWADGLRLCEDCDDGFRVSPECEHQFEVWVSTGGNTRPNPDSWWDAHEAAVTDYVRRARTDRASCVDEDG